MSTLTYSPIVGTPVATPAMMAIVDSTMFETFYSAARDESDQIADATSPFGEQPIGVHTYRVALDGRSGYCVRSNGDLVYVFSLEKGRGDAMLAKALQDGAETLDCFDGYLPGFYARHGFVEYAREANWTAGGPDVVFMALPHRLVSQS